MENSKLVQVIRLNGRLSAAQREFRGVCGETLDYIPRSLERLTLRYQGIDGSSLTMDSHIYWAIKGRVILLSLAGVNGGPINED